MIQEELSGKIIHENVENTSYVILMPEPCYPYYPCNPWFFSDFKETVTSLAPKDSK